MAAALDPSPRIELAEIQERASAGVPLIGLLGRRGSGPVRARCCCSTPHSCCGPAGGPPVAHATGTRALPDAER